MKKIPLTQGKFALVDDVDYDWLNQWKWCAYKDKNTYYARRSSTINGKQVTVMMHREILNLKHRNGKQTDHIDGNGLNNQRFNLRVCNNQQNCFNKSPRKKSSSRFKGVVWGKSIKKWHARITFNGNLIHIGYYQNDVEAARAYDGMAKRYFKKFAKLNFK